MRGRDGYCFYSNSVYNMAEYFMVPRIGSSKEFLFHVYEHPMQLCMCFIDFFNVFMLCISEFIQCNLITNLWTITGEGFCNANLSILTNIISYLIYI